MLDKFNAPNSDGDDVDGVVAPKIDVCAVDDGVKFKAAPKLKELSTLVIEAEVPKIEVVLSELVAVLKVEALPKMLVADGDFVTLLGVNSGEQMFNPCSTVSLVEVVVVVVVDGFSGSGFKAAANAEVTVGFELEMPKLANENVEVGGVWVSLVVAAVTALIVV